MSSRETVASLGIKIDTLLQSVSELRSENTDLKSEIVGLKTLFAKEKEQSRKCEQKLVQLESQLCVNQKVVNLLKHASNKSEQYSRRTSLRFYDVPRAGNETASDCLKTVMDIVNKPDENDPNKSTTIPEAVFDRAHRVGRGSDKKPAAIIVKFTTFRHRTEVYRARQKLSEQFKCVVGLDLTNENVNILGEVKDVLKGLEEEIPIEYVFADINCQLMAKTKRGKFLRFDDMDGFRQMLYDIGHG